VSPAEPTDPRKRVRQIDELVSARKMAGHWRDGDREECEWAGMAVSG
jgi:hypothetical protein